MSFSRQDIDGWLQRLHALQAENVQLKTDLAANVQRSRTHDALEQAEYFQTRFLNKDAAISLLRHELAVQLDAAENRPDADPLKMEMNIREMEEEWLMLKQAFRNSLDNGQFS